MYVKQIEDNMGELVFCMTAVAKYMADFIEMYCCFIMETRNLRSRY